MFHAEMIPPITASVGDDVQVSEPPLAPSGPLTAYQTFLDSRPASFETYAISEILALAPMAPNLPLHIVHLSAIEAIPLLREARANGINITAETCFHYLSLAAESIQDGDTRHKCCPPIREQSNQDGLWDELTLPEHEDSVIKTVVSDHSPCTPELKLLPTHLSRTPAVKHQGCKVDCADEDHGDFFAAWGGISSVGLGISILWTEGQERGVTVEDIVRWCCKNTALQVGLEHCKGDLEVGFDADIAVFDDEASFVVSSSSLSLHFWFRLTIGFSFRSTQALCFSATSAVRTKTRPFVVLLPRLGFVAARCTLVTWASVRASLMVSSCLSRGRRRWLCKSSSLSLLLRFFSTFSLFCSFSAPLQEHCFSAAFREGIASAHVIELLFFLWSSF